MNCKICGKNLYSEITFSNMFKIKYEIHEKCIDELQFNFEEEIIPIDSNIVVYDYVFVEIKNEYNEDYLWFKYFNKVLEKHINSKEWSMAIIYDEYIENFLEKFNPYILINLSSNPILLISLMKMNTFYLERI